MTADLLTIDQTAERLTVSRWTVYRLVKARKLKIVKVRGGTRVRVSEIERYLRAAERNAA
jgi:excisionase family DNA binding protein